MKENLIKVEDSSKYWVCFESDTTEYVIKWDTIDSAILLAEGRLSFLISYALLAIKYGIGLPNYQDLNPAIINKAIEDIVASDKTIYPEGWISLPLNQLYIYKTGLMSSSILFTKRNSVINPERIVNIEFLEIFEDSKVKAISPFAQAVNINFFKNQLFVKIDTDAFFLEIDNKKTKADEEIGGKGCWVDNSELAYLNTPRLNSFLRDLKNLCFEFGATDFEFENLYDDRAFSENGVLFNNEVVYYEDICDYLKPEHRIVK